MLRLGSRTYDIDTVTFATRCPLIEPKQKPAASWYAAGCTCCSIGAR